MNSEEQTLIDGLFSRLQQAEKDSAPRDAQAEARIKEHLANQPAAGYFMAQAILVQEAAIKRLDEQNRQLAQQVEQLQADLQSARNQGAAPSGGGGFLSSIFGGGSRDSRPAPAPSAPASGGWREPARPSFNTAPAQQGFGAPPTGYGAPQQQAPASSSFLGGALKTAAGVAGGVMLAQGISSLFHNSQQPQEIVEILKEEPAQPVNDAGNNSDAGWGDEQRVADNDTWGSDQGGFSDADYNDDSSFFGDDDSFV